MNNKRPETSIVIRALNEERWLPDVFLALENQIYKDFEVVLVDSGSVDKTVEIAKNNRAKIVRISPEEFTFGYSLNIGIKEAAGSIIAIVSAHAIPANKFWLERLIKPLKEIDTAMVYGGQRGHDKYSKFSEKRDFERMFKPQIHLAHEEDPFTNNANSAIKKELWEKHPFDEGLPGLEDTEWSKYWVERGMRVLYEPNAVIIHIHTETWPQLRNRYHREAMAARWIGKLMMRHIPGEIWREIRWCFNDIWQAFLQERLRKLIGEIIRFRFEKTIGTISGIIDSRGIEHPTGSAELYLNKEYNALVVKGAKSVELEKRSIPNLNPGEILIHVSHVGICGTDLEIVDGNLGYYQSGMASYPIVPGHESAGTIVALGPRVTEFNEGDRVVVECIQGCGECPECKLDESIRCKNRTEVGVMGKDGACAEYMVTHFRYAHKIPDTITLAQAAITEPLAVVHKGLRRLGAYSPKDERKQCAVIGAGTIGHLAARVLVLRGHDVTIFDKDKERLSQLDDTISTSDSLKEIENFDWIVEATGNQKVLSILLQQTATGASLLLLGFPYGEESFNFESIVAFDRSVIGSVGSSRSDFKSALSILPNIDTSPFLRECYSIQDFEKALTTVRSRSVLKVMFEIDSNLN